MLTKHDQPVTMPPGKYFVGDPCYCFEHSSWSELLDINKIFEEPFCRFRGYPVVGFGTKYGDGTYRDQMGNEYGVDAGLIGAVPVELIDRHDCFFSDLGQIVEFTKPFTVYEDRGVIYVGHIEIDTAGLFDDVDDDDYEERLESEDY